MIGLIYYSREKHVFKRVREVSLKAAEAVIDIAEDESHVEVIEALNDDNLIRNERQEDGTIRYFMLSFIHEYASQKLNEQSALPAYNCHAKYYADQVGLHQAKEERLFYHQFCIELSNLIQASERRRRYIALVLLLSIIEYRSPSSGAPGANHFSKENEPIHKYRIPVQIRGLNFTVVRETTEVLEQLKFWRNMWSH